MRKLAHSEAEFKEFFSKVLGVEMKLSPTAEQLRTGHIERNDVCLCGSGRKFKKCCLGRKPMITSLGKKEVSDAK